MTATATDPQAEVDVATEIARRCADPAALGRAITASARQSQFADLLPWRSASLAMGHAGIALMCSELDRRRPGSGWDRAGHGHLQAAAEALNPYDVSLFSGLAGVGFAALHLAGDRDRYRRLLEQVDTALAGPVRSAAARLAAVRGCAAQDLDLVSGLAGIGAYLLARVRTAPIGSARESLDLTLAALAGLLADTGHPRAWHTPGPLAGGTLADHYPDGHHNCGIAHGLPGPLGLLSLALTAGLPVPRGPQAVATAASWLAAHHTGPPNQPDWPDVVPLGGPPVADPALVPPGRAAWCYGTPGAARSLWLSGAALGRADWQRLAADGIRAIARRPPGEWYLTTPTFCHGTAGLLQVLNRFAADLGDPEITLAARATATALAARFEADSVLGVRGIEPGGVLVDHPGLLDGAPGVALVLLGPPAGDEPGTAWDRAFLLS